MAQASDFIPRFTSILLRFASMREVRRGLDLGRGRSRLRELLLGWYSGVLFFSSDGPLLSPTLFWA